MMKHLLAGLACAALATSASASTFTVDAFDTVYQGYNGTVSSPNSFTWRTAGYFWGGNIQLTSGGLVVADITTNFDDIYNLFTADGTIGGACSASACIAVTAGQTVSLYSTINSLNGGQGVCCDFNGFTPRITVDSLGGVPEPATWALMIGGFGLAGAALRRRRFVAA